MQGVGTQVVFLALVAAAYLPDIPVLAQIPWWTMLVITVVTGASFVDYYVGNRELLRNAWNDT